MKRHARTADRPDTPYDVRRHSVARGSAARLSSVRIVGLLTWFHPDEAAVAALGAAAEQCEDVVVVDNTPGIAAGTERQPPGIVVIRPGRNLGLAAALNVAARHLPRGVDAVLLLDQDSRLPDGAVAALARHLDDPSVAIAAPSPWDADRRRWVEPGTSRRPEVVDRDAVITSGMLIRRCVFDEIAPFREDFFVDAVDIDFCLRVRAAGWRIVQDRTVRLAHRLGSGSWHRVLGVELRATHHPEWRLYAAARNSAVLIRENALLRPRWAVRHAGAMAYWFLTTGLLEPPRGRRLRALARGVRDGVRDGVPTSASAGRPPPAEHGRQHGGT